MSFAGEVPPAFEREHGCTPDEWRRWLGEAFGAAVLVGDGAARVPAGPGHLDLDWQVLPPRRIARLTLPRMRIGYRFEGLDEGQRRALLARLDLHTRRGGG